MARQRPGAGPTGAVQDRKFVTGTHNQTLDLKDLGDVVADTAQDGDILPHCHHQRRRRRSNSPRTLCT